MPNIPSVQVGNTVYDIKDVTAREHLVEVSQTRPTSVDNKLWIQGEHETYNVPTVEELNGKIVFLSGEASINVPANSANTYLIDISSPSGGYVLKMATYGLSGDRSAEYGTVFANNLGNLKSVTVRNAYGSQLNWKVLWTALFMQL